MSILSFLLFLQLNFYNRTRKKTKNYKNKKFNISENFKVNIVLFVYFAKTYFQQRFVYFVITFEILAIKFLIEHVNRARTNRTNPLQ